MNSRKKLNQKKGRRIARVRALVKGTAERPRLAVRRTNRFIYAQLINDTAHRTLVSASSVKAAEKQSKSAQAFAVGEAIGQKAAEKGITQAVFDRRSYRFHGRVKQLAEGAKKYLKI